MYMKHVRNFLVAFALVFVCSIDGCADDKEAEQRARESVDNQIASYYDW